MNLLPGAMWLAARRRYTQNLLLQLRSPAGRVVGTTLMAAQNTPSNVSQLVLKWGQLQVDATGTQLLSYLAAAAKRLRVLDVYIFSLPALPSLPNLQHLILTDLALRADVVANLARLSSLQTLRLYSRQPHLPQDEADQLKMDLACLKYLRRVSFNNGLVIGRLSLPPSAELHLSGLGEWAYCPVWQTVLPALRTFRWSAFYMKYGLPPVLQPSNTLSRVVLDVYRFAPQQASLRIAFSPFTSVLIRCETGSIDLSGGRWRHLSVIARGSLVLSGPKKGPLQCPDFYLEFKALEGSGSAAISESTKRAWSHDGRQCMWKGSRPCSLPFDCSCGACASCLSRSGDLHTFKSLASG